MKSVSGELIERLDNGGRILVSRLRHLGDVVLTLPLVECLHEIFPRAEVHYLAESTPLLATLEHPCVHRTWESPRTSSGMAKMMHSLRRQSFDLAIDLFANPRSALLLFASGAGVRLGEDRRLRRHLYTHARHLQPGRTALQQHLTVLADLGLPSAPPRPPLLYLTAAERDAGRAFRQALLKTQRLVLFHVDASHPSKEWPTQHWGALAQHFHERGVGMLVSRAPGSALAHRALMAQAGLPENLAFLPAMPLRQLLGLLAACDALVSVDGGVMHCAVALKVPTVALFGPTDASIWFPYEEFGPYRVIHLGAVESACAPHLRQAGCLQALPVEEVEKCVGILLENAPFSGGRT